MMMRLALVRGPALCQLAGHHWVLTAWQGDLGEGNGAPAYAQCKRCKRGVHLREESRASATKDSVRSLDQRSLEQ